MPPSLVLLLEAFWQAKHPLLWSWMENIVLPCMAIYNISISSIYSYIGEYLKILQTQLKGYGHHGGFKKTSAQQP